MKFFEFAILASATTIFFERARRTIPIPIFLVKVRLLPYFPGARQDRIMVSGEPLTSKGLNDLRNTFQSIFTTDSFYFGKETGVHVIKLGDVL